MKIGYSISAVSLKNVHSSECNVLFGLVVHVCVASFMWEVCFYVCMMRFDGIGCFQNILHGCVCILVMILSGSAVC